jgi:inosine/guanosine/xanthosine phosphorylase family protein
VTALDTIRARAPGFKPRVGIVLGTGLGGFAAQLSDPVAIPYGDLDGFPLCTNTTHRGELVLGHVAGRAVACLAGRAHLYEGASPADLAVPIRTLAALGCRTLIVTNAAGSLDPTMPPGHIMVNADYINFQGANPLIGPHDPTHGERFVAMNDAYDPDLRHLAHDVAGRLAIALGEGVYIAVLGPCFETPAEIRAFRMLGADAVGMSTVHEVIAARQAGLRVLGLSLMTNMAAGLVDMPPSAEEVVATAAVAAGDMIRLIEGVLAEL